MSATGEKHRKIGNGLLAALAGSACFVFTLGTLLLLEEPDQKVIAALAIGAFALVLVWTSSTRASEEHYAALAALIDRFVAGSTGDLHSPAPDIVKRDMPALASAVEALFEEVGSKLDHIQAAAFYDSVTSLPNRVHFKREGERVMKARAADEQVALLFIDLDGFKQVNDSLGHAHGDQMLAMVADRLRLVVKAEAGPSDESPPLIARLAGDEFTLLFPSMDNAQDAVRIAQQALSALSQPFHYGGQNLSIGASIGIALGPGHGADLTSLMKAADIAMYHAKRSGRSQFCLYDSPLAAAFDHKRDMEKALRGALARDEFELVYQPQLCARTGQVVAGEAQLRWDHPAEGIKGPGDFIDIAEESTLILAIGDWVLDGVAAALGRWRGGDDSQADLQRQPAPVRSAAVLSAPSRGHAAFRLSALASGA